MELIYVTVTDQGRYNIPIANAVAMIIPDKYHLSSVEDIVLANCNVANNNDYHTICSNHSVYTSLYYRLLFPYVKHEYH